MPVLRLIFPLNKTLRYARITKQKRVGKEIHTSDPFCFSGF